LTLPSVTSAQSSDRRSASGTQSRHSPLEFRHFQPERTFNLPAVLSAPMLITCRRSLKSRPPPFGLFVGWHGRRARIPAAGQTPALPSRRFVPPYCGVANLRAPRTWHPP